MLKYESRKSIEIRKNVIVEAVCDCCGAVANVGSGCQSYWEIYWTHGTTSQLWRQSAYSEEGDVDPGPVLCYDCVGWLKTNILNKNIQRKD